MKAPSNAARRVVKSLKPEWQKVPYWVRGSHIATLIRQGWIEHRWPFDLTARLLLGHSFPWLSEGEIRPNPNQPLP